MESKGTSQTGNRYLSGRRVRKIPSLLDAGVRAQLGATGASNVPLGEGGDGVEVEGALEACGVAELEEASDLGVVGDVRAEFEASAVREINLTA